MLRGEWTPRNEYEEGRKMTRSTRSQEEEAPRADETVGGGDMIRIRISMQVEAPKEQSVRTDLKRGKEQAEKEKFKSDGDEMEDLESSLRTLHLVPDRIRFGRGSQQRGFARKSRGRNEG
jgi:hypothetical protein